MKYGKILTYKNIEEAKKLIGKKVAYSNCLSVIENLSGDFPFVGVLKEISEKGNFYICNEDSEVFYFQFIREVIEEPQYRPFNNERHKNCQIINKIPKEHGRIVDLDKVLDWLINEDGRFSMATCAKIDNALKNAPVILEANNETETPRKACICPHYQGACGLDEDTFCYCSSHYEMCDKYNQR